MKFSHDFIELFSLVLAAILSEHIACLACSHVAIGEDVLEGLRIEVAHARPSGSRSTRLAGRRSSGPVLLLHHRDTELVLSNLPLIDLLVDGCCCEQSIDVHGALLTVAPHATHRLQVRGRIPLKHTTQTRVRHTARQQQNASVCAGTHVRIEQNQSRAADEIESNSTGLGAQKET